MSRFKKDYVAFLMALLIVILPFHSALAIDYPQGDLNGDGTIDELDVPPIADLILERNSDYQNILHCDLNQDGVCDVADVVAIQKYDGDWDKDGVPDASDAFPFDPEQSAASADEIPMAFKLDTDNDGYAEIVNPYRIDSASPHDTDKDGTLDRFDTDDDGDGISDVEEQTGWNGIPNSFHDGGPFITDSLLTDTDRDHLPDGQERSANTNPLDPDTDGDGVLDGDDSSPLDTSISSFSSTASATTTQLSPEQIAINKAWQNENLADQKDSSLTIMESEFSAESSGRGVGFEGPEAVGSSFESVQSDLFSGAFSYSIPIKVAPGRAGMQPNLALTYRSTNNHSWLGIGWDLNPGRIERSTKHGPPNYDDPGNPSEEPDTYVYVTAMGATQLVYTGTDSVGGQTCGIYHAEIDSGSFVRFIYFPAGYWETWMKDGHKACFGKDHSANASVIGYPPSQIFSWGLEREEDKNGNTIKYKYIHPGLTGGSLDGNHNMYLSKIEYNFIGAVPNATIEFERY